jgi:hypothetical protein
MKAIFISYRHHQTDEEFALRLYNVLNSWGYKVWLDKDIAGGYNWVTAIHQGLKDSDVILGILTPESLESKNVLNEWGYGIATGKHLILLWLKDIIEAEIPHHYMHLQRINLRHNEGIGLEKLREDLEAYFAGHIENYSKVDTLSSSQLNLLKMFWEKIGRNEIGKKLKFEFNGSEKRLLLTDFSIEVIISGNEIMSLARAGYVLVYTSDYLLTFTKRILEVDHKGV